jgi:two-component system, OmpR family, sensor histidine kinase CiaH
MFGSLRLRMALSHAGVLLILLAAVGTSGYFVLAHNLDRSLTSSVVSSAGAEADRLVEDGVTAPPDSDTPSAAATRIAVYTLDGRIVGEAADVPPWLHPRAQRVATISAQHERVRIVTVTAKHLGVPIATVVAARSLAPQEDLLSDLRWLLVWGGVIAAALSFLAGWFLAGAAAKPIRTAYGAQERFAADASHELRTPLAFLRSGIEVTAQHDPELGDQMLHEIDYLSSLTSRLLALARTHAGRSDVELQPVRVDEITKGSVERATRSSPVEVVISPDGDPIAVADPVLLEAVLDAVLENVSEHGGGEAALSYLAGDGHVTISVADRGPGLTAELRARVLEPFFRADPSRRRTRGGAGLGLALAASLAREQGGSLQLSDTPGGGLTVSITLRAARA